MVDITKRNGSVEPYDRGKIAVAIGKSFKSTGNRGGQDVILPMVDEVEASVMADPGLRSVEKIQDAVEKVLMSHGFFDEAKSYILYRWKRTERRNTVQSIISGFEGGDTGRRDRLAAVLRRIQDDFQNEGYSLTRLSEKFNGFCKAGMTPAERLEALVKAAVELTSQEAPDWEYIAGRLLSFRLRLRLDDTAGAAGLHSLYDKILYLTKEGLYGRYILENYSREEIDEAQSFICPERDLLFNWSGLDLLIRRYIISDFSHRPVESVQEMFIGISLHLAMKEERNRMQWVRRFYDMLSQLKVTMATPTLSNARKPYHQLSSCFIDTVPDSLEGIYRSIDNFAKVSKFGGGMGLYFGKVRATGGAIRGFKGVAGGVIRWIRIVNDTAVAVDQLGMRQGAVAVYLDVWHKDLPEFLQLRINNGDDRMKAHDVFPAVCYPDLFWKLASESLDNEWHMFCPNEIERVKGYCLEDSYGEEWERRYMDCVNDRRISRRTMTVRDIIRLVLKSAVETGTPFTFNRDTVNRANPNSHKGMIYCSNLCTEIAQNMSGIETVSTEIRTGEGDTVVVTSTRPGSFVVCNLASLSLGHIRLEDDSELRDTVRTAVRALDNVIDLNYYPLPYAEITNRQYRSIGLGISGYHHALALRGIRWESEEHLEFADRVSEKINFYAIEASCDIAAEKGRYSFFEGSEWQTGEYFRKRGYCSEEWRELASRVTAAGMRNAYLIAIAPTSSTGIIGGTTAGVDPVMKRFFLEEKKGSMLPRVAPDLSDRTWWCYKGAYVTDQTWSVRACGVRQRHIDQAQSMNLYITNDYTMRQVLDLYLLAWKCGVKTVYYVRSKSLEVEECDSCSA